MARKAPSKVTAKAVGGEDKPAAKGRKAKAEAKENSKGDWERFPKPDPKQVALAINMRFGNNGPILRPASEAWNAFDLRRPNGISSIDIATGGGLPAGGVCQIDGPESTGKNYLLYRYFAEVQRHYGKRSCLAMACFENFVDKHFAQMCGVKVQMSTYDIEVTQRARKLRGEEPLTKAEIKEAMECPGMGDFHIFEGPAENVLDGIVYAAEHNIYQIIGIDSWDMMLTAPEDTANLDETPQVASPAMLQTKWSKKILDALNPIFRCPECARAPLEKKVTDGTKLNYKYVCPDCGWKGLEPHAEVNETTVIAIRQSRAKLDLGGGKTYGRKFDSKGAYALQHVNLIRLSLYPGSSIKLKDEKIGKEVNWEITKGKAGTHEGAAGSFSLYFNPLEVDTAGDLLAQCLKHGVIEKKEGARYVIPEIEMEPVHGEDKMLSLIESEPELTKTLKELLNVHSGLAHVRLV